MRTLSVLCSTIALLLPALASAEARCTYLELPGLVYGRSLTTAGYVEQHLDAYIPLRCDGQPLPLQRPVGLIHGGGFVGGSRDVPFMQETARGLAARGFAAFSIDYRLMSGPRPVLETLTPEQQWRAWQAISAADADVTIDQALGSLAALEDALKAKAWVADQFRRLGIRHTPWGVLGSSAGAVTALQMAYSADDYPMPTARPAAVVDLWGGLPVLRTMEAGEAALLAVHGTDDATVPYSASTALMAQAQAVGVEAWRITMPGVGHGPGEARIFTRPIADGSAVTIFEAIVFFFDRFLRPD